MLTTIILALVVTGMLSLTDQLFGRKQLADFSRVTIRAEETAENIAETLCDRIKENAAWLTSDFASGGASLNQLDNWLTRGFVKDQSDIDIAIDAPTMTASHFAQLWNAIDALPIAFPLDCVWLQAMPASPLKSMVQRDAVAL